MAFVKVATLDEIPPGTMKLVNWSERNILVANVGGTCYAMEGRCTHMGTDLSGGRLEGSIVTCPKHGQKFDVTTGRSIQGPKIELMEIEGRDEPSYAVRLKGKDVLVDTQ